MRKSYTELGQIMLIHAGRDVCLAGYGTDDPYWVGYYALVQYHDINVDGTLN